MDHVCNLRSDLQSNSNCLPIFLNTVAETDCPITALDAATSIKEVVPLPEEEERGTRRGLVTDVEYKVTSHDSVGPLLL